MNDSTAGRELEVELDGLISLAEKSTTSMDQLAAEHSRAQLQLLFIVVAEMAVGVGGLLGFLASVVGSLSTSGYGQITGIAFAIFAVVSVAGGLYVINSRLMHFRRLRRELMLERDISENLLSMIDNQYHRVRREEILSAVALATLEIRIRRLDRSKAY